MTDDDDPALRTALRRLSGRLDPVPEHIADAARAAFDWRDMDAALATLTADSALAGSGVRGGPSRLLSFEAGDIEIAIEVSESSPGGLRLMGQLVPPGPATISVEQPGRAIPAEADVLGRFRIDRLTPGPSRIVCRPHGAQAVLRTEWTVL